MPRIKDIPIALQLWSVKDACAKDFPGTLRAVKQMGYDGVEFAGFYDYPADKLRDLVAEIGLKIAGSHTGMGLLEGDKKAATISYNQTLGNNRLVVPAIPGDRVAGGLADWQKIGAWLNALAKELKPLKMKTGFHNHAVECQDVAGGGKPLDAIFDGAAKDLIMQIDIGWAFRAGTDARDWFAKYPKRSETVHVKAYSAKVETATVGEDDIPWKEVLKAAVDQGKCEWFIVEHERHAGDPLDNVRKCLDYLRSLK